MGSKHHQKDFDGWSCKKKLLHQNADRLFFHEGEIWWVHLGVNIGYEIDGKKSSYSRPVIVLKKYNHLSFLALPLSTVSKKNPYFLPVGEVDGREAFANLSQLRNIDSKRLINKVCRVSAEKLVGIKKKSAEINLG